MDFRKDNENIYYGDLILGENKTKILEFNEDDIIVSQPVFSKLFMELNIKDLPEKVDFTMETYENYSIYTKYINSISPFTMRFHFIQYYWNENIILYDYINLLAERLSKVSLFDVVTKCLSKQGFDIEIKSEIKNEMIIKNKVQEINEIFITINNELLSNYKIEKNIEFKKEHLSAGISILQYFGKILQEKYPNEQVSISIKQEDLKITMTIETPDGKKEEIEEYLNRFGMVVMNQLPMEKFALNPIQLLELKQELRDAQNKIAFQQELLILKDETYKNRISSLEDEVKFLRKEFSSLTKLNNENIQLLLSSLIKKDDLLSKLTKSIEKRDKKKTEQLLLDLKQNDSSGYVSLKEHIDNAIIGGIVNAPTWIQFISGILPKA